MLESSSVSRCLNRDKERIIRSHTTSPATNTQNIASKAEPAQEVQKLTVVNIAAGHEGWAKLRPLLDNIPPAAPWGLLHLGAVPVPVSHYRGGIADGRWVRAPVHE